MKNVLAYIGIVSLSLIVFIPSAYMMFSKEVYDFLWNNDYITEVIIIKITMYLLTMVSVALVVFGCQWLFDENKINLNRKKTQ